MTNSDVDVNVDVDIDVYDDSMSPLMSMLTLMSTSELVTLGDGHLVTLRFCVPTIIKTPFGTGGHWLSSQSSSLSRGADPDFFFDCGCIKMF